MSRVVFCLMLVLLAGGLSDAHAVVSNNVPLDHWSYGALDKLAGFGLIHSDLHGTRPYTRMEVARLVNEALTTKEQEAMELPPLIEHFLQRFQGEFSDELAVYGRAEARPPASFEIKPVEEAKARYVYVDGQPRDFVNFRGGVGQFLGGSRIIATEGTRSVANNEGVLYGEGNNFSLQFASSFKLWDLFSGYVEPILVVRGEGSDGRSLDALSNHQLQGRLGDFDQTDVDVLKGYAKLSPWNIEVEAGRDSMWWGQGYRGTLILTDNAAPLEMVKISNPTTTILPWLFSYLGPFKYTFFLAVLDEDRDFPHARLGGVRVDFKPFRDLEIGMSRTFIFGGDNARSSGSFLEYLKIASFLEEGGGDSDFTDQLAAFDLRYRMPYFYNAEVYLEWGGEDTGIHPKIKELLLQDLGYIVGIYLPKITKDGRTDLRVEYADNVSERDQSFWYGHGQYFSGYTYNGLILGHPMGPDALDIFTRVTHYLRNDLLVGLDFDYAERGRNLATTAERGYQAGTDVAYDVNDHLTVKARYTFGLVENFNLIEGDDHQDNLFQAELKYLF